MQTLMSEEEFLMQRNVVYEPDAKADEPQKSDENREDGEALSDRPIVIIGDENDEVTQGGMTASAVIVHKKKKNYGNNIEENNEKRKQGGGRTRHRRNEDCRHGRKSCPHAARRQL